MKLISGNKYEAIQALSYFDMWLFENKAIQASSYLIEYVII